MGQPRVAVIGAGLFGTSAAVELSKFCTVDLYEAQAAPFLGATFANHNRHHFGFHYPRSLETAQQCVQSADSFSSIFGDSLFWDFDNYYCVAKQGSHVTAAEYLRFLETTGVEFHEVDPPSEIIDASKIALCVKAREPVCDYSRLRDLAMARIKSSSVNVFYQAPVVGGGFESDGRKYLLIERNRERQKSYYDCVVNATYANSNLIHEWFGLPQRLFQFNLQELNIVDIPRAGRPFGVTIMDGMYPSVLPYGRSGLFIMAHAEASQLKRESSFETVPLLRRQLNIESNWEGVRAVSEPFLPILAQARYCRSIFVDRVVDSTRSADDSRVTEITGHGNGCWTIFAAKVITCISTSQKLAKAIQAEVL